MRDFQSKRRIKKALNSRISLLILIVIVILLMKGVWDVYGKNRLAAENRRRIDSELKSLTDRESELKTKISSLNTDRGKEEVIRKNLPVAKEGEHVITVVDTPASPSSTSTSFWERWFGKR